MNNKIYRIMFVCHGNICRSPMAEFIMKKMVEEQGLSDRFYIASSATSTEEIYAGVGNPVYPPARRELLAHGIDPGEKRAVQLKKEDYENYDAFIAMDSNNIRNIHRIFGSDRDCKVARLMDFTFAPADVADPWYSDRFDIAYRDICAGCRALLDRIIENGI